MLFVIDIGNTDMVLGIFEDGSLTHEWRVRTDRRKTEDEFGMLVRSLLYHKNLDFADIQGIIISSVVPPIMFAVERMCQEYFHIDPMVVGKENVHSTLKMAYPNPEEIGADRVVNAVAAIEEYGAPLVIVDFGTATTHCFINEDEAYQGGSISPGIDISMEALYRYASKLPKIEIQPPPNVVGSSTVEAMQTGVFYGFVGQVDEIARRMKQQSFKEPRVIATGGLAPLIADASNMIDTVDKHLTLKGLYLIYIRNSSSGVINGGHANE